VLLDKTCTTKDDLPLEPRREQAMQRFFARSAVVLGLVVFTFSASAFATPTSTTDSSAIDGYFTVLDPGFPSPTRCPDGSWSDVQGPQKFTGTITTPAFALLDGKEIAIVLSYVGGSGSVGIAYGTAKVIDSSVSPAVLIAKGPLSAATNGGDVFFTNAIWLSRLHFVSSAAQLVLAGKMSLAPDPEGGGIISATIGGSSAGGSLYWDGTKCS
jgi:hypothetical protein